MKKSDKNGFKIGTFLFFDKLEIYTKTDIRYFLKGGAWIGFENMAGLAASLLLGIVFANILSQTDYGVYKFVFTLVGLLGIFLIRGLGTALIQAVAKGEEGIFRRLVNFQIKAGIIYIIASLILAAYYLFFENNQLIAVPLIFLGLAVPFITSFGLYQPYLLGKKEFKTSAIYTANREFFTPIVMILAVVLKNDVIFLIAAYALAELLSSYYFYRKTIKKFPPNNKVGEGSIGYATHITITEIFNVLARQIDNVLLFQFFGPAVLAQYTIVQTIPSHIYSFSKSITGTFLSKLAGKTKDEVSRLFYKRLLQLLLIGSLIALIYFFAAPLIFQIIFPIYQEVTVYSQWLAADIALGLAAGFIGAVFFSQKIIGGIYKSTIFSNVSRITLYLIFGLSGGLKGMVIAYILSRFINVFANVIIWEYEKRKWF